MNARTILLVLATLLACDRKEEPVAKAAEPVKAAEPAKAAEPVKPAESAKAIEPAKPVEAAKPVDAVKPVEAAKPAEPVKPAEPEDDFALMKGESFGDLKIGMTEAEAKTAMASLKRDKGKCEFSESSGDRVTFVQDKKAGVQLTVSCDKENDVQSIRVFGTSTLKSKRGIGIGDTTDAVTKAYGDSLDPQSEPDPNNIIAGSVYGGLAFTLKDGKVTEMFLGALAE